LAVIGIRREDKSVSERRTPLVPDDVRRLVEGGVVVHVQGSERRCFADREYREAGARVAADLSGADVILGVKEIPAERLEARKTYLFFSHTMKGQPANMPMLRRILELGCSLLDYELIADERGVRTIAFGRFAGVAGAIDTLWALGRRFRAEGIATPFAAIRQAAAYGEIEPAREAIARAAEEIRANGLPRAVRPLVIGITGEGGKVFGGALEMFEILPARRIAPRELAAAASKPGDGRNVLLVGFGPEHLVEPVDASASYSWEDYVRNPTRYRARFATHLPRLTALVHGIFWKEGYPRFILRRDLQEIWSEERDPKLKVITDITCDLGGSNESLVKVTEPQDPAYLYEPRTGEASPGWRGAGPVVLAVDILPAEIPVDASRHFSRALTPLVPALAKADPDRGPDDPVLPEALKRSFLAVRGKLLPAWEADLAEPLRRFGGADGRRESRA
jgi:alpha-aminoadipic semialdehyde synthase